MKKGLSWIGLLIAPLVHSAGVSPYLPVNTSPLIERHIEHLMALTSHAPVAKPYAAADIKRRLKQIQHTHPQLHGQLSHYLRRYTKKSGIVLSSIDGAVSQHDNDSKQTLPNQGGETSEDRAIFEVHGFHFFNPYVYVAQGVQQIYNDDGKARLVNSNSHIGLGNSYMQLDVGYRPHWLSAMQYDAMVLSANAEQTPSVTLSNSVGITPWNVRYQLFYQTLDSTTGILSQEQRVSGKPRLAGMHVSVSPIDSLTLGYNQVTQYGGGEQDYSIVDHITASILPSQLEQQNDGTDLGYQLSSTSFKWSNALGLPLAIYGEVATSDGIDNAIDNRSVALGGHLASIADSNFSISIEHTQWQGSWYQSDRYENGFRNDAVNLGHAAWLMDTEESEHTVLVLATPVGNRHYLEAKYSQSNHTVGANTVAENTILNTSPSELALRYHYATDKGLWRIAFTQGKDSQDHNYQRVTVGYEW